MEDRETPRMHKYGKVKWLKLWWQLYITSLPDWDVRNFRLLDFCWTKCTQERLFVLSGSTKNWRLTVGILVVGQYTETKCIGEICIVKVKGKDLVRSMEARGHLHTLATFLPGNELANAYWKVCWVCPWATLDTLEKSLLPPCFKIFLLTEGYSV
jgi:hypothetical protein